jgi:hypothetical protein
MLPTYGIMVISTILSVELARNILLYMAVYIQSAVASRGSKTWRPDVVVCFVGNKGRSL